MFDEMTRAADDDRDNVLSAAMAVLMSQVFVLVLSLAMLFGNYRRSGVARRIQHDAFRPGAAFSAPPWPSLGKLASGCVLLVSLTAPPAAFAQQPASQTIAQRAYKAATTQEGVSAAGAATINDGTVVVGGESHNAQLNIGNGETSVHWLNRLNADPRVRNWFKVVANYAVSGQRSDQWAPSQTPSLVASPAKIVLFGGWVNSIATPSNHTADQVMSGWASGAGPSGASDSFKGLLYYADQVVQAGKILIWPSDWGQEGLNASQITQNNIANEKRRGFCRTHKNVYCLERNALVWQGANTGVAFRPGWANDSAPSTHIGTLGAYWLEKAAYNQLQPLINPQGRLLDGLADNNSQGGRQLLTNAGFAGSTGTKTGSGTLVGDVPNGWTISVPANMTATVSLNTTPTAEIVPGLPESMPELVIALSNVTADGTFILRYDFVGNSATGRLIAGHAMRAVADVSFDAGSVGNYGAFVDQAVQVNGGTNYETYALYNQFLTSGVDYGAGPSEAYTVALQTKDLIVPSFSTVNQWRFDIVVRIKSGGSATFRVRAPGLLDMSVGQVSWSLPDLKPANDNSPVTWSLAA